MYRKNKYGIPENILEAIKKRDKKCVYCGKIMKKYASTGKRKDMATIEHFNFNGPFYWEEGLKKSKEEIADGKGKILKSFKDLR